MDLTAVHVTAWDVLSRNASASPVVGGRKYRTSVDAIGLTGIPCSAYFTVILLDRDGKEITRKVRWLNDFSGTAVSYPLVFTAETDATSAILGYRINCDCALQAEWMGRLSDLSRVRLRRARKRERECLDDLGDVRRLGAALRAADAENPEQDAGRADAVRGELDPTFRHLDFSPDDVETVKRVRPFTMTSNERIYALIHAIDYVVDHDVPGDIVECGVWKGGSMMAAAIALMKRNVLRDLYLFDTFAGMPEPTQEDVDPAGRPAAWHYRRFKVDDDANDWCLAPLAEARKNLLATGYPVERMHFIEGKVEVTVPAQAPEVISVLRLDTDFYASTRHEMEHLFPRLSRHGVLVVDDYGYWQGVKSAVDEYVREHNVKLLLSRVDFSGRVAVKV